MNGSIELTPICLTQGTQLSSENAWKNVRNLYERGWDEN